MAGEFYAAWNNLKADIWDPLACSDEAPSDLYCELLRTASTWLKNPEDLNKQSIWEAYLLEALTSPESSKVAFNELNADSFTSEKALCNFLEDTFETLQELSNDNLAVSYEILLRNFIAKFNLRYELLQSCKIMPTVSGIFWGLLEEVKRHADTDAHVSDLLAEFENSIRDLKMDSSESRIKTCIQKQVNLLEAITRQSPLVTKGDLAGMCGELKNWPHLGVKSSIACLYSFASEYPGIRHGGNPEKALRSIELRDFVSMTILLTGCLPYLSDQISPEAALWGN